MPLQTIIKEKRKELGLTQEQIADYLGVSTPAVNKWENGITYPDITLLSPLARLLKTDLNTLLCFKEELTKQEIQLISSNIYLKIQQESYECGFRLAKEKIDEYPNSVELIHNLALILDGALMLFPMEEKEKKKYENEINSLYERISQCDNEELRNSVNFMLASKYIQKEEFDKAQKLIDYLPERSAMDKKQLTANLFEKQAKFEEAEEIHERLLLSKVIEIWNHLLTLISLELKLGQIQNATKLATTCSSLASLFEFSDYYKQIPQLQIATYNKDIDSCIMILEALFVSMQTSWGFTQFSFYRHIQLQASNTNNMALIMPAVINELETNPDYEFLRTDERYQSLMEKYQVKL